MHIYTTLQKGSYHLNYCEDFLVTADAGHQRLLCAVMDGCTMGTDSHFAATLTGKILKKIAVTTYYKAMHGPSPSLEQQFKDTLRSLFTELKMIKQQLLLDTKELLTTLLLLLTDTATGKGIILAIGDGTVVINGTVTTFEQDNKPDYLGYHLGKDFELWYAAQTQFLYFDTLNDVSIATDGIELFEQIAVKEDKPDPLHFLLQDTGLTDKEDMLALKLKQLEHVYGMLPGDDLAIIRLLQPT